MFYEVLSEDRQAMLPRLKSIKDQFYLAGGTALALQLGHRDSIDFDFFRPESFATDRFFHQLENQLGSNLTLVQQEKDTLTVVVDNIKVSFFAYPYPLLEKLIDAENLKLASLTDIGCMKVSAIVGRATMKDYVDLYFILQHIPLKILLEATKKKYPALDIMTVLKGLIYFDDIDAEPLIYKVDSPPTFDQIKQHLIKETKQYLA